MWKWITGLFTKPTKAKPKEVIKSIVNQPKWIVEGMKLMGYHEVKNNSLLRTWLKSDGKALGDPSKFPWCFTGDVQILTSLGWQNLDNVTANQVYQVDDNNVMSLTDFKKIEKDYVGELDVISHRSFTLKSDPNHKWYGSFGTTGREKTNKIDTFGRLSSVTTQGLRIPSVKGIQGKAIYDKEMLGFLAAVLSDGSFHRANGKVNEIRFEVSKERKIKRLDSFFPAGKFVQKEAYGPLTKIPLTVFSFKIPDWFWEAVNEDKELNQNFVNSMTQEDCKIFLDEYRVFDGMITRFHLYTSSEIRLGHLSQICTMAGYKYGVSEKESPLSKRICYEIHVGVDDKRRLIRKDMLTKEQFSGKLYCVQVPSSRIVVREKNKGAVVTGNCGDFVETALKLSVPNLTLTPALKTNPYWARNWAKFGVEAAHMPYGSVVVLARGTGGHVAFAVGRSSDNRTVYVLGGNQSDSVSIVPIKADRIIAVRWPSEVPMSKDRLPVMTGGTVSVNEA
jgi:uncharacterized protein (TIGR02594 family)